MHVNFGIFLLAVRVLTSVCVRIRQSQSGNPDSSQQCASWSPVNKHTHSGACRYIYTSPVNVIQLTRTGSGMDERWISSFPYGLKVRLGRWLFVLFFFFWPFEGNTRQRPIRWQPVMMCLLLLHDRLMMLRFHNLSDAAAPRHGTEYLQVWPQMI